MRPPTLIEQKLANIWADVLHVDRVGIHDNFFELGGHSLLAMQVMRCLRDQFHLDVPVRALFENPSVEQLASLLGNIKPT